MTWRGQPGASRPACPPHVIYCGSQLTPAGEERLRPKKTKEMIAIGISVQMDCESCMQWHIDQAAACGATLREILEAVEVGMEMGAGRVTVAARFALDVMERAFPNEKL